MQGHIHVEVCPQCDLFKSAGDVRFSGWVTSGFRGVTSQESSDSLFGFNAAFPLRPL